MRNIKESKLTDDLANLVHNFRVAQPTLDDNGRMVFEGKDVLGSEHMREGKDDSIMGSEHFDTVDSSLKFVKKDDFKE